MHAQHRLSIDSHSRFFDPDFNVPLAESARGLASVSGGHDYLKDSWIPFSQRLEVFRKSSREGIRPIQLNKTGPDPALASAQGIRNRARSTFEIPGADQGSGRAQRLLEARKIGALIDIVSIAVENFPAVFEAEAQFNPAGATRAAEETALLANAEKNGLLLNPIDFFIRWRDSGANGGQEHQVIVGDSGQPVEKRTNVPYFHDSWRGYFERIRLHNILFPEASITVKGFHNQSRQLWTPYGEVLPPGIYCVIEQPFVNWEREATPQEIRGYLHSGGFLKVLVFAGEKDTGEWYNPKTDIHLVDVRSDNLVMARGDDDILRPVVVDVPIRLPHTEQDVELKQRVDEHSLIDHPAL